MERNPVQDYLDATERLTRPHLEPITGPDGAHMGTRLMEPMLQTLATNVAAGVMRGGGAGAQLHTRSPLNMGAANLLAGIRGKVATWYAMADDRGGRPDVIPALLEVRLSTANAWRGGKLSTPALDRRTGLLQGWAQAITDLLDPPMRIEVTAPCPRCHVRWHGEDSVPALSTTYRDVRSAITACSACHAEWYGIEGARRLRIELDEAEHDALASA